MPRLEPASKYMRTCTKCNRLFYTSCKFAKVCLDCMTVLGRERYKYTFLGYVPKKNGGKK